MAKVQIKSDRITPFGGIFPIMEKFDTMLSSTIDSTLGLRCRQSGFQYSEILRSLMCVYFSGGSLYDQMYALRGWKKVEINGITFELNSILVEKWKGKVYRLVIQRQKRHDAQLGIWDGEYTYRCILTNDYASSEREVVEFYNLRCGKERILDDMNNGFGWDRLPKSFMDENTVFLLLTALIHNFYKAIMQRLQVSRFGLKPTSRIKAFVFKFISVSDKWVRTSRRRVLNIYTENTAYARIFSTDTRDKSSFLWAFARVLPQVALWGKGKVCGQDKNSHQCLPSSQPKRHWTSAGSGLAYRLRILGLRFFLMDGLCFGTFLL